MRSFRPNKNPRYSVLLVTAVAAILLLALVPVTFAATYYVDATSGQDSNDGLSQGAAWKTIAKVNAARFSPGDQILLKRGGKWRELLTVTSSGNESGYITYGAYGTGELPIITGADMLPGGIELSQREYGVFARDNVSYIIIDGFKIENTTKGGIFAYGNTDNWIVRNCTIENTAETGIDVRGYWNAPGQCDNWIIEGNRIGIINANKDGSYSKAALFIRGTKNITIRNNYLSPKNVYGILVDKASDTGGALSSSPEIYGNELDGCSIGIQISSTDNAKIYRNHIHDGDGFGIGIQWHSNNAQVYYNLIHNQTNLMNYKAFNGIDINHDSQNGFVYNNTVAAVAGHCITVEDFTAPCNGWVIRNNILDSRQNTDIPEPATAMPIYVRAGVSSITLSNNDYVPHDSKNLVGAWKGTPVKLEQWNEGSGDTSSISSDPGFADSPNGNYKLESTSPCRYGGVAVGLTEDLAAKPVPASRGISMGALQYAADVAPPSNMRVVPR